MSSVRHGSNTIAFYLFLIFAITFGCGRKGAIEPTKPKSEEILARVGEEVITTNDYKEEFAMLPPSYRNVARLGRDELLENLINKRLLLQEAKRRNLENSENVKRLFNKVKEEIMIQQLLDRKISDEVEVTDSEIEKHYSENQNKYMEPAKIRASHILVDSELIAKKILEDLNRGGNFAELAKEYSLDISTKDKGGDLGYFEKGALLSEFELACDKLNVGEMSDVVKTDLGYHIIKVLDKKESRLKILEEVKDDIKSELLLDKEISLYNSLLQELRKNQNITINKELLEEVDLNQLN